MLNRSLLKDMDCKEVARELKKELKDGVVRSCYYFTGPEAEIKKIYIHKVAEVAKAEIVHADSLEAIYANL
jgi:hypothetical protein